MQPDNKSIVDAINKTFDDNHTEAFLSYCADDVVWIMPGNKTYKGKESIRQMMKSYPEEAPQFTIKDLIGEADMVMCRGNMEMKDKDGNNNDYVFCDVYKFNNSKVVELTSYIIKEKKAEVNNQ